MNYAALKCGFPWMARYPLSSVPVKPVPNGGPLSKWPAGNLCCLWQCDETAQDTFSEGSRPTISSKGFYRVSADAASADAACIYTMIYIYIYIYTIYYTYIYIYIYIYVCMYTYVGLCEKSSERIRRRARCLGATWYQI